MIHIFTTLFTQISGLGFFSMLTFVASFIPVAGIFVATLPPLIVALTEHGLLTCAKVRGKRERRVM